MQLKVVRLICQVASNERKQDIAAKNSEGYGNTYCSSTWSDKVYKWLIDDRKQDIFQKTIMELW